MWNGLPSRLKLSDEEYFTSLERISSSHRRCEQMGLSRDILCARDTHDVRGRGLAATLEYLNGLISYAELLFATTFDRIPDKRTLLILTDARAQIIAIHSSPEVIRAAADKGVYMGASVAEFSVGTNAVSLALHDLKPTILHGKQHYCRILHNWYCVAIPLIDAHGSPLGCVDISMSCDAALGEKFALANFLARDLSTYGKENPRKAHSVDKIDMAVNLNKTGIRLTERQQQVLMLFSQGLSYKQIAQQMGLQSTKTVQEHLDAVRTKFGAMNRRDCIGKAIRLGFLGG